MAKPGRKSKLEKLDETTPGGVVESKTKPRTRKWLGKRDTSYGIMEKIRDDVSPQLILDYWLMILQGFVPRWVRDARNPHGWRVIADENQMSNVSTPAQRDAAIRELTIRGWGQAPQSFQIEAHLKATIENGIPQELLSQASYAAMAKIRDALRLEDGNTEDAEIISESSAGESVSAIANSVPEAPEETIQPIANSVPEAPESQELGQLLQNINENSPPEDDSSGQ